MIKSYKLRRHIANAFVYLFLIVMGFVWISPFIYLLMHSFRGGAEIYGSTIIPQEWTLQNYIDLFTGSGGTASLNFPRWFLNTFVVACFSCVISTISVLMVSYAFSRLRFKARKKFMNVGMILGMFPGFMTMIAIYYLLKAMGLTQTLVALVICYSCGAGCFCFASLLAFSASMYPCGSSITDSTICQISSRPCFDSAENGITIVPGSTCRISFIICTCCRICIFFNLSDFVAMMIGANP